MTALSFQRFHAFQWTFPFAFFPLKCGQKIIKKKFHIVHITRRSKDNTGNARPIVVSLTAVFSLVTQRSSAQSEISIEISCLFFRPCIW